MKSLRSAALSLALTASVVSISTSVEAQCLDWSTFSSAQPETFGTVRSMVVHDDGSGPALYLGGALVASNGTTSVGVRRWDGANFSDVGSGLGGTVTALASYDDGSGSALYAAGMISGFPGIARWNGTAWQGLGAGPNGIMQALAVFDSGTGPELYVGGFFPPIAGLVSAGIARFNAHGWAEVGTGVTQFNGSSGSIHALAVSPDATTLYVAGSFLRAGGIQSPNIARWSAGAWSASTSLLATSISTLAAGHVGGLPYLFAGGDGLNVAGIAHGVARYDGTSWTGIDPGGPRPFSLAVLDTGAGEHLYRGWGPCTACVRRWDGATWTSLGVAAEGCAPNANAFVSALAVFDEGAGPRLFLGGDLSATGLIGSTFSRRDGDAWVRVGEPLRGPNAQIHALHAHDDGTGPVLYAAGEFTVIDDRLAAGIARWDGAQWYPVGFPSGRGALRALATIDVGQGPELYVGGDEGAVYRLRAGNFEFVGGSNVDTAHQIRAIAGYDAGAGLEIYVGGIFSWFGGTPASNLARWNGSNWRAVGGGVDGEVRAFQVFDNGAGPALYIGGAFTHAGTNTISRIARWDGLAWSGVGGGLTSTVQALTVHDSGTGIQLYAGGAFVGRVARLNANSWQTIGTSSFTDVAALASFDDGAGRALFAGGFLGLPGDPAARGIVRWSGASWSAVGTGVTTFNGGAGLVNALAPSTNASSGAPELAVAGLFTRAGGRPSRSFAIWSGCPAPISTYCAGDGTTTACPCANSGALGNGCQNSASTGGARLVAQGTTAPDTIVLDATGELPNAATLVFQGSTLLTSPVKFGDGLRCVGGTQVRLYTTNAMNGALSVPGPGQPSISARSAALGDVLTPGSVRGYQTWYRDPNLAFCVASSGNAWNLSNAVRIVW